MPRKKTTKTTVKKAPRKVNHSSHRINAKIAQSPVTAAMPPKFSVEQLRKNKPLVGAIGIVIIILLLLAFPLRFLIVPAMVNGQPIFSWEYISELHQKAGSEILTQMINQKLIEQEISNQNIQIAQNEIDEQIKKIEDSIGTESGGLDAALSLQGMTKNDLIKQIKLQLQLEKLVKGTITISDEEIKSELAQNPTIYTGLTEIDAATTAAENLRSQTMSQSFSQWFQKLQKDAKIYNFFKSPVIPLPQAPSK